MIHERRGPMQDQPDHLTVDDYFRVTPPDVRRWELLGGVLVVSPSPWMWHQELVKRLLWALQPLEARGLGRAWTDPNVVLGERDVVDPDVVYVRAERRQIVEEHAILGPPDLVVEVLSPSTRRRDLTVKRRLYARTGVLYWAVDPKGPHVEVFRPGTRRGVVVAPPEVLREPALDLEVDLAALFAPF